jgi:hypothetical protein
MTWHSFFDLHTMEHRHLLSAYAVALGVQLGYFGWIVRQWTRIRDPRT